ncbi:hypothetical protein BOX15_Mlig001278g1 [Macrostomum lignano]|uniref:protein-histidine N-methyltransferase n=1 Tax=Macrostomum lignano TaxID=282301 RepID=A0A267EMP0_9PLAT|nr:hypothetical protein BOX15_Mlig001278g1 [Macrostomum lignano]
MALEVIHKKLIQLCAPNDLPSPGELQSTFEEFGAALDKLNEIENGIGQPMLNSTETDRLGQLSELRQHVASASGGFVSSGIGFANFGLQGVGLRAEEDVKAGQLLLKVPRSQMLTHTDALLCPAWRAVRLSDDPMCQRMPNACLALYLLHHLSLGPASPHSAYLNCLPTGIAPVCLSSTPTVYRRLSVQPTVRERILIELRNTCRQYLYFYRLFNQIRSTSSDANLLPLAKSGCFTYAAYRWAVSMVMSRNNAVPMTGNNGDGLSNNGTGTELALVPLWDMGNHRFGQMSTDYSQEDSCLVFYAMEDAPAGSQLYFMYGRRSNADFFLYSGFSLEPGENPYDTADLRLGLNPKDRLIEVKTRQLQALGLERSQLFHLPVSDPIQPSVLAFARLICAQSDEEVSMAVHSSPDLNRRAGQFLVNRFRLLAGPSAAAVSSDNDHPLDDVDRFLAGERAKFQLLVAAYERWTESDQVK